MPKLHPLCILGIHSWEKEITPGACRGDIQLGYAGCRRSECSAMRVFSRSKVFLFIYDIGFGKWKRIRNQKSFPILPDSRISAPTEKCYITVHSKEKPLLAMHYYDVQEKFPRVFRSGYATGRGGELLSIHLTCPVTDSEKMRDWLSSEGLGFRVTPSWEYHLWEVSIQKNTQAIARA